MSASWLPGSTPFESVFTRPRPEADICQSPRWSEPPYPYPGFWLLGSNLPANCGPKQFTVFTVESRHLHLLDGEIVGRAGVDLDARQQQPEFEVLEVGRLPHDVLAGELVAALLEHLNHGLRCQITVDTERARFISLRKILIHESGPFFDGGIFLPGWIGRVLEIVGRQNAL